MNAKPLAILSIDDDPADARILFRALRSVPDIDVRFAACLNAGEALAHLHERDVDVIFLDYQLGAEDGMSVLRHLRRSGDQRPIIVLTGQGHERLAAALTREGADDYLVKGDLRPDILQEALDLAIRRASERREQARRQDRLLQRATLDHLTGVSNRWVFDERVDQEWRRAMRGGRLVSVVICDIDHFKLFNDTYGHLEGDRCLARVAASLAKVIRRPADLVARYGGEEFVVLLPETDALGTSVVAELLRSSVEALAIPHASSPTAEVVTISLGTATARPTRDDEGGHFTLLGRADAALYQAKSNGRNQVIRAE